MEDDRRVLVSEFDRNYLREVDQAYFNNIVDKVTDYRLPGVYVVGSVLKGDQRYHDMDLFVRRPVYWDKEKNVLSPEWFSGIKMISGLVGFFWDASNGDPKKQLERARISFHPDHEIQGRPYPYAATQVEYRFLIESLDERVRPVDLFFEACYMKKG